MIAIFLCLFVLFCAKISFADTVYLKNGRSIEGIISKETDELVELQISGGVIKFKPEEVKNIEKSDAQKQAQLKRAWQTQKEALEKRLAQQKAEAESRPRKVEFSSDERGITVLVTLNKKVEASLILDTGASLVMLRKNVAERLGLDLDKIKQEGVMIMADGRQVKAKHVILESLKTQGVEAKNVEAAILMEEVGSMHFGDGLLGMSFLKKFNFKIDNKNKRLILEKL